MPNLIADVRLAIRALRARPSFTLVALLSLTLGIGANTTIFSIANGVVFTELPAPKAEQLARLVQGRHSPLDYENLKYVQEHATSFDAVFGERLTSGVMTTDDGRAERFDAAFVTGDYFRGLQIRPALGQFFVQRDDVPSAGGPALVLSYDFWQTRFGGDPSIVGKRLRLNERAFTVVAVAPQGFASSTWGWRPSAWMPFSDYETFTRQKLSEWNGSVYVTARLKAGVDLARAAAEMDGFAERLRQSDSSRYARFNYRVLTARGINEEPRQAVTVLASALLALVSIVLVIACANVANLLLARALKRQREIAVRIALGVSRGRLLMQLATESMLLAALGGAFGLVVAQWGGAIVRRAILDQTATASTIADFRTLLFVSALAAITGLLTGLAPALQAKRGDVAATLKAGSREGTVQRSRLRVALLIGQAAMSVVLLVGAGLFVRSLLNVKNLRLGYDVENLVYVDFNWRGMKVDSAQEVAMRQRMLEQAKTLPGVVNAARALTVPFAMTWSQSLFVAGIDSVHKLGDITLQTGSPEIFETMGTRILRGRGFTSADNANAPYVMVVNELMAKKLWPNQDAIGKCVRVEADTLPCRTVVGIAENVRRGTLSEPEMHFYMPADQYHPQQSILFVRTSGPGTESAEAVRRGLQPLLPGLAYVRVQPMSNILAPAMRSWRLGATMFAVFGMLALVLAAVGLYSVIAYNVTQRTHEMGVRVALGAQRRDVVRLIVREGLVIVLPGIALGTAVALLAGSRVKPLLFDVSPKDPWVITGVVVTLLAVAIVASWAPATRASRVDPNEALRSD